MSQLYSIRSKDPGRGDFEDLKTMLVEAKKKTGSDFMLINPMHAAELVPPLTPSPYLPISAVSSISATSVRSPCRNISRCPTRTGPRSIELHEQVESLK